MGGGAQEKDNSTWRLHRAYCLVLFPFEGYVFVLKSGPHSEAFSRFSLQLQPFCYPLLNALAPGLHLVVYLCLFVCLCVCV